MTMINLQPLKEVPTTDAKGNPLTHKEVIVSLFEANPDMFLTPELVRTKILPERNIASIRSAFARLTHDGFLEKSKFGAESRSVRPRFVWRMVE